MKNAKVKEIVVPAVSLFLICAAVTALLALTNQVTAPRISQLAIETENRTKKYRQSQPLYVERGTIFSLVVHWLPFQARRLFVF